MYRGSLRARFSDYWRLEIANAILLPVFGLVLFWPPGPLGLAALVPMCGLLIIGGLYWRAKLHQLEGRPETLARLIPVAGRLKPILAIATAVVATTVALAWLGVWFGDGLFVGGGDRAMATIAAVLAVAEYVNYYHRQLQHFDRAADWRRLLSGRGFRRARLAVDLDRWRATRRAA